MSYTLQSGLSSARISDADHGEFVIDGGVLEVDDYDTAAALVDGHGSLFWPDGDPQPVAGDADSGGADEPEPEPDDGGDVEPVDFDSDAWLDRDYEERADAVAAGERDDRLDAIKDAERSKHVLEAVEARQAELGE